MSPFGLHRSLLAKGAVVALALLMAAPLVSGNADAHAGGGSSFGSRGTRSFSAPPTTPTAPRYAQPFERTQTPNVGASVAPQGRFGFGSGLLAGLLGAGLMGSLFGGGFMSGVAGFVGLLFKLALVGGLIWLVVRLFRRRAAGPLMAGGGGSARMSLGGQPGAAPSAAPATGPATVAPDDYAAFERSLVAVQEAYSREDLGALGRVTTPEIAGDLGADIEANRRRGLRNDVSRTRLVKGDLSEAWSEGAATYATVAMRFSVVDVMVERASGRIASGDPVNPVEAVELWTFRRDNRGPWLLSGIQQAA